jgi:hypothetical protein
MSCSVYANSSAASCSASIVVDSGNLADLNITYGDSKQASMKLNFYGGVVNETLNISGSALTAIGTRQ